MSLEQDFHNFIEAQEPEAKQRGIEKVMAARATMERTPIPKRPFPWKKLVAITAPSLTALGVGAILLVNLFPTAPIEEPPRYCASGDYVASLTAQTLQEYAAETNQDILTFDWYTTSDYDAHYKYALSSGEVVCFTESRITFDGDPVTFSVTKSNTTIEDLSNFENLQNSTTVDGYSISYATQNRTSYASFVYGKYRYYLQAESSTENYVLELAEILLPDSD